MSARTPRVGDRVRSVDRTYGTLIEGKVIQVAILAKGRYQVRIDGDGGGGNLWVGNAWCDIKVIDRPLDPERLEAAASAVGRYWRDDYKGIPSNEDLARAAILAYGVDS